MPLLTCLSAHMYPHYIQILREDVNTTRKTFSDSFSKISASSIGSSLPYLSHRYRQVLFIRQCSRNKRKKIFIHSWKNTPENHVLPLAKQNHTEIKSLFISESTEKSEKYFSTASDQFMKRFVFNSLCTLNFHHFQVSEFFSPCSKKREIKLPFLFQVSHLI